MAEPDVDRHDPEEPDEDCVEEILGIEVPCRRPGRFRRWILRPIFWGLAGLAVLVFLLQVLLNSEPVRRWLGAQIATRVGAYLSRTVTIDDLSLELVPFSIELWGITVDGGDESDVPFLEVPWVAIDADLDALQHNEVRINQIRAERPRIHLEYLPGDRSNILSMWREKRKPRRFDVLIDRIEVDQAEFLLDQESVHMSIDAEALRARFEGLGEHLRLAGQVVAQSVAVRLPNARPQRVAISAQGTVERGRVEIVAARITGPDFSAHAQGFCEWSREVRSDKKCLIDVDGSTRGELMARLGYFQDLEGAADFDGTVAWRPGSFGWRGRVEAPRLDIWKRRLDDVRGTVVADRYAVRIHVEDGRYGDGKIAGDVEFEMLRDEDGEAITQRLVSVDLDFGGVLLDQLLADQHIPAGACAVRLGGNLQYRFAMSAGTRGSGHAEVRLARSPERPGLAFEGAFPLRIERGVVRADSLSLSADRQSALASGWFDLARRRGQFDYEVASVDVAEIAALLPFTEAGEERPLWLPLAGEGDLGGTLFLRPDGAETDLRLRLERVRTPGLPTPHSVAGSLHYAPALIEPLRLELAQNDSALDLAGRIPLAEDDPRGLVLAFDAYDWSTDTIHPWLPFEIDLDGRISGHLDLHVGPGGSDGRLRAALAPVRFEGIPLDSLAGGLSWDDETLSFSDLVLRAPAGTARGGGTLTWAGEALDLAFETRGLEIGASPLASYLPRPDLGGRVAATARIGGSLAQPSLQLDVEAGDLSLAGRKLAERPSRLDVLWSGGDLRAEGRLLDMMTLRGGGEVSAERRALRFDLDGHDIAGLLELLLAEPPEGLDGTFGGSLRIELPDEGDPAVDLVLDTLDVDFRGRRLRNLEPVSVGVASDHLDVRSLYLGEPATESELFVSGRLGLTSGAPVDLHLQSTLAADWFRFYEPDLVWDGRFDLLGRIGGTVEQPYLDGQGELREASVRFAQENADFPHQLEDFGGIVLFYPDGIVVDHLDGGLANGRVELAGRTDLPRRGVRLGYRLQIRGRELKLRYPEDWLLEGDLDLTLRTLPEGYLLSGRAELGGIHYSENIPLGLADVMEGFLRRQRLEVDQADALLAATQLNVAIAAPGAVKVRNNLAQLTGSADLVMRGTLAQPVFLGEVEMDPGGQVTYNGTDYRIQRGRLTFSNPYALDPEIDLVAATRQRDFEIILTLSGTMEHLETNFSSEPPLPDLDVFELLASGGDLADAGPAVRRVDALASDEEARSAASFLYGQAASVIGERVNTLFGFDKFRIDPLTGSGDNLSKARVTVGKRLSKDVFVTFSADPSSTEDQRLQIEWQLSPRLVLVLTQNGDNTYSADARWETSF